MKQRIIIQIILATRGIHCNYCDVLSLTNIVNIMFPTSKNKRSLRGAQASCSAVLLLLLADCDTWEDDQQGYGDDLDHDERQQGLEDLAEAYVGWCHAF